MKVQHRNRDFRVDVTSDGEGLVSNAGGFLLAQVADRTGLTGALSAELSWMRERTSAHDPGRVIRDLAVTLATCGDALTDLGALRSKESLFGRVASDSTAFRMIEKMAHDPEFLGCVQDARKAARGRMWDTAGRPGRVTIDRVTIDLDGTLIRSHSEKEGAAGDFKGGYGFHPMMAFIDETPEAAAAVLRPGNAGANTAEDQILAWEIALGQIPGPAEKRPEVLLRSDSAGAVHDLLRWAHNAKVRFSVGFDRSPAVRDAIDRIPKDAWVTAENQDGKPRENGQVTEATGLVDLSN